MARDIRDIHWAAQNSCITYLDILSDLFPSAEILRMNVSKVYETFINHGLNRLENNALFYNMFTPGDFHCKAHGYVSIIYYVKEEEG